jgi:signal transduction histidine kinase
MHPAEVVLAIAQLLLFFLIPALLGLLTYKSGVRARFWFGAGVVYALYLTLLILFPSKEFSAVRLLQMAMLWTYIACLIYFLLIELGRKIHVGSIVILSSVPIAVQGYLSAIQASLAEQVTQSLFVFLGDTVIAAIALALVKRGHGKGFLLVAASGLLVVAAHLIRLEELLLGSGNFSSRDYTWKTNFLVIGHLIAVVFVNIGYAGVVLERSARKEALAKEGQRLAEDANRITMKVLEERDQMVMLNSQFAAISGASVFAATIIHEITQPIQAIVLAVHNALREAGDMPRVKLALESVNQQAADCNAIIQSLRTIMSRGQVQTEQVDLVTLTGDVLPVIQSQCKRRGIALNVQILSSELKVNANSTLYKRLVFNLITNAIEALDDKAMSNRELWVVLKSSREKAVLEIRDNSGKVSAIEDLTFETLAGSTKPTGMGLGLMLCGRIATSWNGKLSARMDSSGPDRLTVFSLELPLASGAEGWQTPQHS